MSRSSRTRVNVSRSPVSGTDGNMAGSRHLDPLRRTRAVDVHTPQVGAKHLRSTVNEGPSVLAPGHAHDPSIRHVSRHLSGRSNSAERWVHVQHVELAVYQRPVLAGDVRKPTPVT